MIQAKMEMYAQIHTYFCKCSRYPVAAFPGSKRISSELGFGVRVGFFRQDLNYRIAKKELKKGYFG